jgi:peptidyl-tRNA hydrolase, PTH1 family
MKLIIGLGNPGKKYERTRHNAGFLAIDHYLSDKEPIACQSKFAAEICELHFGSNKVLFIKPQSFMNKSGEVILEIVQFYKVDPSKDILVVHDEKDLPLGTVRETDNSSSAGHNGVQNIIDHLGTQNFHRIRIGVESRQPGSPIATEDFVLQNFSEEEFEQLNEETIPQAKKLIDDFIK